MITSNLGFPRIGPDRELKRAVEGYWKGRVDRDAMLSTARQLTVDNWRRQADAGIEVIPSNDYALYDHVLDHLIMFGMIPDGYGWDGGEADVDTMFAMARGTDSRPAIEMTKWFNTNYHYISGILDGDFTLTENRPLAAWRLAQDELGLDTRPVIVGPYTFLRLANNPEDLSLDGLLESLLPLYRQVLSELSRAGVSWVQIDEPALVQDLPPGHLELALDAYRDLDRSARPKIMLQTYFDDVASIWSSLDDFAVDGIGMDFVYGPENLSTAEAKGFPDDKAMGIGLVDGRNVWRTDVAAALETLNRLASVTDLSTAYVGPSCSLLHLPYTAVAEERLDPEIRSWLAFADERLEEIALLRSAIHAGSEALSVELDERAALNAARLADARTRQPAVRERVTALAPEDALRDSPAPQRRRAQADRLSLPPLPTTTIGSFPQTSEIRKARARHARGELTDAEYTAFLDEQFRQVIDLQEDLGLDVLVHGEFERSDMVDYFAQRLEGMAFIEGWVQSYGTRCVRPPLIFGDVYRPEPMTVDVAKKVQSMTHRPLKGMLTGPVTMLMWSFPRDDLSPEEVATQLALAIRDEVQDLEAAGIRIIQIDEPAFREGLPLQRGDWPDYLDWATRSFRIASCGVDDTTQIHTHMCYSEFNDMMPAIAAMDADVLSIENSRSAGELLEAFRDFEYNRGIGPGVYDVHSERVPETDEMADLIRRSAAVIDPELVWVNPDCGLKTRGYQETEAALRNMVEAAKQVRSELFAREPAG